jgi:glycerol-3-phosphate responsive antiterminator
VLAIENRQEESIAALDRYFQLDSLAAARDHDAVKLRALEVRMLPGGDIAQRAMRKELMR